MPVDNEPETRVFQEGLTEMWRSVAWALIECVLAVRRSTSFHVIVAVRNHFGWESCFVDPKFLLRTCETRKIIDCNFDPNDTLTVSDPRGLESEVSLSAS